MFLGNSALVDFITFFILGITSPLLSISRIVPFPIWLSCIYFPLNPVTHSILTPLIDTVFTFILGFKIPCFETFHSTSNTSVSTVLLIFFKAILCSGFLSIGSLL